MADVCMEFLNGMKNQIEIRNWKKLTHLTEFIFNFQKFPIWFAQCEKWNPNHIKFNWGKQNINQNIWKKKCLLQLQLYFNCCWILPIEHWSCLGRLSIIKQLYADMLQTLLCMHWNTRPFFFFSWNFRSSVETL